MVWLPVFGVFNVHTRDCTQGLYGHRKRVCTGSWLWKKNPLPHRGLEPASVLRGLAFQSDALPAELLPPLGLALTVKALMRLVVTGAGDVGSIPRFGCLFFFLQKMWFTDTVL